jgi:hypothetical protein
MTSTDRARPPLDPVRKALPNEFDVTGVGVRAAAQGKILSSPQLKANADNPSSDRLWYTAINGDGFGARRHWSSATP